MFFSTRIPGCKPNVGQTQQVKGENELREEAELKVAPNKTINALEIILSFKRSLPLALHQDA